MKILYWFFIGLMVFIYFIFPVVMYVIARLFGKEPRSPGLNLGYNEAEFMPFVSLIIAAHDEEKVIEQKVRNIISLDYPQDKLEIIFALDGCTDKTKEKIEEFNDSRIRILDNKDRLGKVVAINNAVTQARGEIILFSDANSMHEAGTLKKIIRNFADEKVGCVSGRLSYVDADKTSVGKGENLYWKYETFIKKQESRLGKLLITNGSIQAVRKDVYPFPDPNIADDFSIPLLIQAKGYKVIYEPEAVVYEVATKSLVEELSQKTRILSQGLKGALLLRKHFLKLSLLGIFELLFHKILRWWVGVYMVIIFFLNLALLNEPLYFNLFILQLIFYALALVGFALRHKSKIKIFYIPFYFCLVNFAALMALWKFIKNEQTRTWNKAHTTRVVK